MGDPTDDFPGDHPAEGDTIDTDRLSDEQLEQPVKKNELLAMEGGGKALAIIPGTLGGVVEYAKAIHASGLAPDSMKNANHVTVAILKGLELGLPPMQALENIAIINNRASLWGDIGLALIMQSGKCEMFEEGYRGSIEDGDLTAWVRMKRKGLNPKPTRKTFSMDDAKTARLWAGMAITEEAKRGKSQWVLRPKVMLQWKARWLTFHALFSDVLRNMPGVEEMIDELPMRDITPRRAEPVRRDIRERLTNGERPSFTYAERTAGAPPAADRPEEGDDTGDYVDASLEPDGAEETATEHMGGGGGGSFPANAGGTVADRVVRSYDDKLRDDITAALDKCTTSAEVLVVGDDFKMAIGMASTSAQHEFDALISDKMLSVGFRT